MPIREIAEFRCGKQTHKGRPTPTDPQRVTVVTADSIDAFLRTTPADRRDHLRGLRDLGLLVHDRRRLTKRVRTGETNESGWPRHERAYVFNVPVEQIPRKKRRAERPRQRIATW